MHHRSLSFLEKTLPQHSPKKALSNFLPEGHPEARFWTPKPPPLKPWLPQLQPFEGCFVGNGKYYFFYSNFFFSVMNISILKASENLLYYFAKAEGLCTTDIFISIWEDKFCTQGKMQLTTLPIPVQYLKDYFPFYKKNVGEMGEILSSV